MTGALRLGRLLVVTFAAGTFAYAAVGGPAPASAAALPAGDGATVRLEIDGLRLGTVRTSGTVAETLERLGLLAGPADRLSVSADAAVVPGLRIGVDRGIPVTLVDGGRAQPARARPTTVGGFLASLSLPIDADDVVATPLERDLGPGDVVQVVRVAEREVTEIATHPYRIRTIEDASLDYGRRLIEVRGQPGEVRETYAVRYRDGIEAQRMLLSSVVLRSPVTEVWRVGVGAAPRLPHEIEEIIRGAAAAHGADAEQLLRVAWCESKLDPLAYNPTHGDSGLFQFIPRTWAANSVRAGYGGASPFDPVASANVAAWMFAHQQSWQWSCK